MEEMVLYFYSDGDLVMCLSKIIAYILIVMVLGIVLGTIRGLMMR